MKKSIAITTIIFSLFLSVGALTAEIEEFNTGSVQFIASEDKNLDIKRETTDDIFLAGEDVSFSGKLDDAYLVGRSVHYKGDSAGSVTAFAEDIIIDGIVNNNLHSAASDIRINGLIKDNTFLGAEDIVIGKEAEINGTLFIGSSTLHILGTLNDGLVVGAGEVIIDGPIVGNVKAKVGKIIITERGSITGNLEYGANNKLTDIELSRVTGKTEFKEHHQVKDGDKSKFLIILVVSVLLSILISGLLIHLIPTVKSLYADKKESKIYGKILLWGILPLFILPVVVLVTIPLLPISITLALAMFPIYGLSTIFGISLIGEFLFSKLKWKQNIYKQYLIGTLVYIILFAIPFVNVPVIFAVSAMGAGLLLTKLFKIKL